MATKHFSCLGVIISMLICVLGVQTVWADGDPNEPICCTSPNNCGTIYQMQQAAGEGDPLITFSEYPVDTYITDQYADLGIIFGGDDPFISSDGSNPTSPVLSGSPRFQGDIEGYFVSPYDGESPATVSWFSLDAGYFNEVGSTLIEWFDLSNNKLGEQYSSITGIETFVIEDDGIASFHIGMTSSDSAGYAIDNINFGNLSVLDFSKVDDVIDFDCREPGEEITYTICWDNTTDETFYNTFIIDYLPEGVDYNPLISIDPLVIDENYNSEEHYYIWDIGTISPGDANCVSLTVEVNYKAEPGMYLHNVAELWSNDGNSLIARDTEDTLVCCWHNDPNIYVDIAATGKDTGVDWTNAYSGIDGLQKALNRVKNSECDGPYTIYVAQGKYSPGSYSSDSFEAPEGIAVYGGFPHGGCEFEYRNPDIYQTVLTAAIDPNVQNDTVVMMLDDTGIDETTLLDGFIITDAMEYGIYGDGVDFNLDNCQIIKNEKWGIYHKDGDGHLKWCSISSNNWHGIEHNGYEYEISCQYCQISNNKRYGITTTNSTPELKNCIIFHNGFDGIGYNGVNIFIPSTTATLYNNTIIGNKKAGISYFDSDPNYLQNPDYIDLQNCIVWYNNDGGSQVSGLNPDNTAYYCCIQDCNDVTGRYNISDEPGFAYITELNNIPDPNNPYHLSWTSPCKDVGNPLFDNDDVGLYDIDAEDRISYGRIDIGADEVYSCNGNDNDDIYNVLDWNADGILNLEEFSPFAQAWLSHNPNDPAFDPNDVSYNPNLSDPNHADYISPGQKAAWKTTCNLIDSGESAYSIDFADMMDFIDNGHWLWTACWKYSQMHRFENMMVAMMSSGGESTMMATPMMSSMSMELTATETTVETADTETDYANMSIPKLVSLVVGIHDIIDILEISIEEDHENAENLCEVKEFLEDVLSDIAASRE